MTRLHYLRNMRDFLDREIQAELGPKCHAIIEQAAELYDVTTTDLLGRSRQRQVTQARQGAAWLLRRRGMSLRDIGNALGYDHTTALYACRKIEASPGARSLLLGLEAAS